MTSLEQQQIQKNCTHAIALAIGYCPYCIGQIKRSRTHMATLEQAKAVRDKLRERLQNDPNYVGVGINVFSADTWCVRINAYAPLLDMSEDVPTYLDDVPVFCIVVNRWVKPE